MPAGCIIATHRALIIRAEYTESVIEMITTQQDPAPIAHRLQAVITQGRELSAKPTLAVDRGKIWIMRARAILGRIYGENAAEVNFWCPQHNVDPPQMTGQNKITTRLPSLERLASILATPYDAAKIFIGHGRSSE